MTMKHYILIDMGTGNSRVALVDSLGKIISIHNYENKYYRDKAYDDAQFFKPAEWEDNICEGCRLIHNEHPDIKVDAVSAAAARQSFVLINKEGESFYGLPNIDNRGRAFMSEVPDHAKIYKLSGKWATEDFGAGKLLGFRKVYPDKYSKIDKITSLSEWIGYRLTGTITMEYSQACESQLYDIEKKKWSDELCKAYGLDMNILPELKRSGSIIGHISKSAAKKFFLSENAVFIIGGADTQTALRQTGIKEGDIAVVSGTTSPVVTVMKNKFYDSEERVWTDAGLGADNYQIEMNPGVTGMNYQRMKEQFNKDVSYEELEDYYCHKTNFACTASFSSLLFYEKRSLRHGGFFMRSPLQTDIDRNELMYAVLADIGCSIYEQLSSLIKLTGNTSDCILGCAGGFQSPTLCQMLADLSGMTLKLKHGYSQATVEGLTSICNEALSVANDNSGKELIQFYPREKQLIHKYYPIWLDNRNKMNGSSR